MPKLNDAIHFVLYYSTPEPDDPNIIGACRGGWVAFVHPDGKVNLNYMPGGQPNEPDNQPYFTEHKIARTHDPEAAPSTWHYAGECPRGL